MILLSVRVGPASVNDTTGDLSNSLLTYYFNPCGRIIRPNNCSRSSAVISCRTQGFIPDSECDLAACTCCDAEGRLDDVEVALTPDCHLSVEFKGGDSNSLYGCKYLDKYPNQTTTIVFMCDKAAGIRGFLEPSMFGSLYPGVSRPSFSPVSTAYFNDDRDFWYAMSFPADLSNLSTLFSSVSFVWKTSVVCGISMSCVPHTAFSVLLTFGVCLLLTLAAAVVIFVAHRRQYGRQQALGYTLVTQ